MARHISSTVLAVAVGLMAVSAIRDGTNAVRSELDAALARPSFAPHGPADSSLIAFALTVTTTSSASGGPAPVVAAEMLLLVELDRDRPSSLTGSPR